MPRLVPTRPWPRHRANAWHLWKRVNERNDKVSPSESLSFDGELLPGLVFTYVPRPPSSLSHFSSEIVHSHQVALWGGTAHCGWDALGEGGSTAHGGPRRNPEVAL